MIIEKMHAINDYILKLNTWWGLHTPGSSGIIITKDKVYSYQFAPEIQLKHLMKQVYYYM